MRIKADQGWEQIVGEIIGSAIKWAFIAWLVWWGAGMVGAK